MTIAEFLDMGGYARFVWPSYALVVIAIALNIFWARSALNRARIEARRRLAIKSTPASGTEPGDRRPLEGRSL